MTAPTKQKVALNTKIVCTVEQRSFETLLGTLVVWWVSYNGKDCCDGQMYERRHLEREEAIAHGRQLVRSRSWTAPE